MIVTATEFKTNLGKYLDMVSKQDVYVTKNGHHIARLTSPAENKAELLDELIGVIPADMEIDEEKLKEERLSLK